MKTHILYSKWRLWCLHIKSSWVLCCIYSPYLNKANTGRPQENDHQQRGGRTLDNSEYPFEIWAATPTDKIEDPFKIGLAALSDENEYSFKIGPAAHLGENKYPFEIEPAALIDKLRIPWT